MKLPCKLDDQMRLKWATSLATAVQTKRELEAEKKEHARKLKVQIDAKQGEIDQLQTELTEGSYLDEVEVFEEQRRGQVVTIRKDTKEVVAKRALTESEETDEGEDEPRTGRTKKKVRKAKAPKKGKVGKKTGKGGGKKTRKRGSARSDNGDAIWDQINEAAKQQDRK